LPPGIIFSPNIFLNQSLNANGEQPAMAARQMMGIENWVTQ